MTDKSAIVDQVRSKYAEIATSTLSSTSEGVKAIAQAFGYSEEELASIPAEANMGVSCGNPVATANLRAGETVLDLGSGGGIDVLLAAQKVGPTGKAIGVDMTPEMIERAKTNAVKSGKGTPPPNVEFHLGRMESLPVPDNSVDCLISNCVINLAEDKQVVFKEMFRALKPGGRVAVSDIALKQPLPPELAESVMAYVGCVAGALLISDYERMLKRAGFQTVQIIDTGKDLNAYAKLSEQQRACCAPSPTPSSDTGLMMAGSCCGGSEVPESSKPVTLGLEELLTRYNVNDFAASVQVYALKPQ